MVGVKFHDLFLRSERLQRNFSYFTVNLPFDFPEAVNILRIKMFVSFFKNSRNISEKIKAIVISKPVAKSSNDIDENHSL